MGLKLDILLIASEIRLYHRHGKESRVIVMEVLDMGIYYKSWTIFIHHQDSG